MNRKDVSWYAVRCCCEPRKVFGFLRLDDNLADSEIKYVKDIEGHNHQILIRSFYARREKRTRIECGFVVSNADQPLDLIPQEMAIYSDDKPIEFWRSIEGFVETLDGQNQPR